MFTDSTFLAADNAGKIAEVINHQWQIGCFSFSERLTIIYRFYNGKLL